MEHFVEKKKICFSCGFFHLVNREEGEEFQLFKLAQGVHKTQALHSKISQMEHLIEINNRLQSHFDLFKTIDEITLEARKITGAQRSIVFLVKGDPPALHGAFSLRGKTMEVSINIDDNSAVGYAAAHNRVVNVEKIGESTQDQKGMVFNTSFDKQCNCETHSLIAIPVHDYEKRVKYGRKGREFAIKHFSRSEILNSFEREIRQLVN